MTKVVKSENHLIKSILVFWLPVVVWATIIFLFSSYPTSKTSHIYWQDFIVKKAAHIVEYAIFTTLLYRAFINSGMRKKEAMVSSFIIAALYGISDEFHQMFTPGREPRARDVFFDATGSLIAIYVIKNILDKSKGKLRLLAKYFRIVE